MSTQQLGADDAYPDRSLAERLGVHERWLPPADHARRIAGAVERGSCHIEHRGHRCPPLLVFDDGGAMELPTVRWMKTDRGERLVSVSDAHTSEQTTHYDVCGTVDSIEAALERAAPSASPSPGRGGAGASASSASEGGKDDTIDTAELASFLTDIEHMIGRMKRRRDEYERFAQDARRLLERNVIEKAVEPATQLIADLKKRIKGPVLLNDDERRTFVETLEQVRDIAQFLEYSLSDYKDLALELRALIDQVRGGRTWPRQ